MADIMASKTRQRLKPGPSRPACAARVATGVVFAVHGAVTGTFAARVPWVAGARPHFAVTAALLAVISVVASSWLLPHRPEPEVDALPAFALNHSGDAGT
jgi:hypothetical protein